MPSEDGQGAVDLLQKDNPGEFVSQRHPAEGKDGSGRLTGFIGKSVGGTDRQGERLGIAIFVVPKKIREIFRGELLAAHVEQDERVCGPGPDPGAKFQQGGFAPQLQSLNVHVSGNSREIFLGQRIDGGTLRFADPGDRKFHEMNLNIAGGRMLREQAISDEEEKEHHNDARRCLEVFPTEARTMVAPNSTFRLSSSTRCWFVFEQLSWQDL
jgi:hypothetical protein